MPFLLAMVLLWQGLGSFVYFQVERRSVRKEIKARLKEGVPQGELVEFRFSTSEFIQLEWRKSNEFVLENHFYDIVKRVNKNSDSIVLKCISDKQEDKLFESLAMMVSTDLHKKHPLSSSVHWKTLTSVVYIQPILLSLGIPFSQICGDFQGPYRDDCSSAHPLKLERPPSC